MKRENLKNLGLTKEAINQIMAWNGFDIEAEKKKLKETEKLLEELRAEIEAEKEIAELREAQSIYMDIMKEAVRLSEGQNHKIMLALL